MKTALIGYTGFVGSTLSRHIGSYDGYNSKNINDIRGKKYDLIVSAGTTSAKWIANKDGEDDWKSILKLINPLKRVKTKQFVLISTVDVYPNPVEINEDEKITESDISQPYGLNRFKLEEFVRSQFENTFILRMPQLFGKGLKKNFIYDLIHAHCLDFTHKDSIFQWYNIEHLWKDIQIALDNNLKLVNFATEPTKAEDVANICANMKFTTITENPPANYNYYSKHAHLFESIDHYLYHKPQTYKELKELIAKEKSS